MAKTSSQGHPSPVEGLICYHSKTILSPFFSFNLCVSFVTLPVTCLSYANFASATRPSCLIREFDFGFELDFEVAFEGEVGLEDLDEDEPMLKTVQYQGCNGVLAAREMFRCFDA